jgi:hypothetical protein
VVGGVGGAILLGGIALVWWRLWNKKKREQAAHDDYRTSHDEMLQQDTNGAERYAGNMGGYSNPNGSVNTASNF